MVADIGLVWYSTPQYTAGLDVRDGVVVEAPPIARWALGRTVDDIFRGGRARGVDLRWINPPFGHTVPSGRGSVEVAPSRCSNGHRLEPWKTKSGYVPCDCDKVRTNSHGHATYECLQPGCGDLLVGDGHTDDSKLGTYRPARSRLGLPEA